MVTTIPEGPRINVEKAVEDSEPTETTLPSETVIHEAPVLVEHNESNDNFNEEGYQSDSDSSDDEPVSFITRTDELYVGGGWSSGKYHPVVSIVFS